MSTIVCFKHKIKAHILDVLIQGETKYVFIETGRTYQSQRVAFKRALVYYKKQIGKSDKIIRRRRKYKIVRKRRPIIEIPIFIQPTITTFYDGEGILQHKVLETDLIWEDYNEAIKDAIDYVKRTARYRS